MRTTTPSALRSELMGVCVVGFISAGNGGCSRRAVQPPVDHAAEIERTRCGADANEAALAPVLDGTAIQGVESFHFNGSKNGSPAEIAGAAIRVQSLPGMTAEWLDRALECHSAKRVLGHVVTSTPDDPFWLPGRTVQISVKSAGDAFRVEVRGATLADSQEILDRANAFGARSASRTLMQRENRLPQP